MRKIESGVEKERHAPQGTQAERAFLTSNTVVGLIDIVSIYKALKWMRRKSQKWNRVPEELTFDVRPPLSGLLSTALRVLKNLGSDGFMKNTSGMIMTLESSTSVSSYDCPKIWRSLFHALCIICSYSSSLAVIHSILCGQGRERLSANRRPRLWNRRINW